MFRIRREQLDFFADKTRRAYVEKMSAWLREAYPECVGAMSRGELETWVTAAVHKAESYRVVMETDVAQLMLLFMILGLDADERLPWLGETLARRDLEGIGKVRKLVAEAREKNVAGIESVVLEETS